MADGDVRIPIDMSSVAHGHRAPDQVVTIVMPAQKNWLLIELEVQLADGSSATMTRVAKSPVNP
jgi:hypothetical protein